MCVLPASRSTQEEETMAKPKMDLSSFVGKLLEEQDGDTLREGIRVLSQALETV